MDPARILAGPGSDAGRSQKTANGVYSNPFLDDDDTNGDAPGAHDAGLPRLTLPHLELGAL